MVEWDIFATAGKQWDSYADNVYGTTVMVPEASALVAFTEFVTSSETVRRVESGLIGCLADALGFWLVLGDGTEQCPTYEFYLQVAIHIVESWIEGPGVAWAFDKSVHDDFCRELEPLDEWEQAPGSHVATSEEGYRRVVIPRFFRQGYQSGVWNHPAFRKAVFENIQFRRRNGKQFVAPSDRSYVD